MTTSRVIPYEKPNEEKKRIPEEILRLQSLLLDNGWKMLIEKLDKEIADLTNTIMKPIPMGLNDEQTKAYNNDLERLKMRVYEKQMLKNMPYELMEEYGESEFRVDMSNNI